MALTITAWPLNTYTASTWTDWITSGAYPRLIKAATVCNTSSSTITLSIRKVNSTGIVQNYYLDAEPISPKGGYSINVGLIALAAGDRIQINASSTGLSFDAAGA